MSRIPEWIDERRRASFDAMAEQYDARRPGYPPALVAAVLATTGARRILEVGAGTGQATVPFAREGCEVVALEPGLRLGEILRRKTAAFPSVRVVRTTFEEWSADGKDFDLVLAAQSFHWVDPALRYTKASSVARHLAVMRNDAGAIDPQVRTAFDAAYEKWTGGGDGNDRARSASEMARAEWTREIDESGVYGPVEVIEVPWNATYDAAEYLALIDTYSDNAVLEPSVRRGLYESLATAIDRHGGRLFVPYVAMALVAAVDPKRRQAGRLA